MNVWVIPQKSALGIYPGLPSLVRLVFAGSRVFSLVQSKFASVLQALMAFNRRLVYDIRAVPFLQKNLCQDMVWFLYLYFLPSRSSFLSVRDFSETVKKKNRDFSETVPRDRLRFFTRLLFFPQFWKNYLYRIQSTKGFLSAFRLTNWNASSPVTSTQSRFRNRSGHSTSNEMGMWFYPNSECFFIYDLVTHH